MSPIWCSSLLIDGPLLGFCVWSNILSLFRPSGKRIQTNKKSPRSLGLSPQMKKKKISAKMLCTSDPNWIFNFTKLKWKLPTKKLTSIPLASMLPVLMESLLSCVRRVAVVSAFPPNSQQQQHNPKMFVWLALFSLFSFHLIMSAVFYCHNSMFCCSRLNPLLIGKILYNRIWNNGTWTAHV